MNAIAEGDYVRGGTQKDFYHTDDVEQCNCPLCDEFSSDHICYERGAIGVVKCKKCDLIYISPRVKNAAENYHGKADVYIEEARLIFNGEKDHHRDRNYEYELNRIKKYKKGGSLLDIGCNMGFFLRKARQLGFDCQGIDASPSLSKIARDFFQLNVVTNYFTSTEFPPKTFDVITLIDVFEHIPNPIILLSDASRTLKDDGIVCIKVPNGDYNYLKFKIMTFFGKAGGRDIWDSYEHLGHYTVSTMNAAAKKAGFLVDSVIVPPPIQSPVWHKLVGHYYQYPSPWFMDWKNYALRNIFYYLGKLEVLFGISPRFAPDLMFILRKAMPK